MLLTISLISSLLSSPPSKDIDSLGEKPRERGNGIDGIDASQSQTRRGRIRSSPRLQVK
jgi:hypothetical protein